jgi:hypothetical protein
MFHVFALSFSRGLGFGQQTPGEFWIGERGHGR